MTAPTCVVCGRPTADGYACHSCARRTDDRLAAIIDLTPDARLVAAGLVRRGGGHSTGKPGSRSPGDDGAMDTLDEIHDRLARTCIHIATLRGLRFHVPCLPSCIKPSPAQAHCGVCHTTFGGISGFDRHRRDGQCLTPEAIGYTPDTRGVYRAPMTEAGKARLASLRAPETAETSSGVGRGTLDDHKPVETPAA